MATQVQIEFGNSDQLATFVKWFKKQGYPMLITSNINIENPKGKDNQISCMSTDEKMEWGHYFELE